ncbi:MAG: DUF2339 domain-containing protein [Lentisphaeria bacterium]|nr:DUF2339 domain-containing protein [Lentisphaeria bacterium]
MEGLVILLVILIVGVIGFVVPGLLIALNSKVGDISAALERIAARLEGSAAVSQNAPERSDASLSEAEQDIASYRRRAYRASCDSVEEAAQPLAESTEPTDSNASQSTMSERPATEIENPVDRFLYGEGVSEEENSLENVSTHIAEVAERETPPEPKMEKPSEDEAAVVIEESSAMTDGTHAQGSSADVSQNAQNDASQDVTAAAVAEDSHDADAEGIVFEAEMSAAADNASSDTPRSNFSERMNQLRKWLVYGRAYGCSQDDASEKLVATTWLLRIGILVIFFAAVFLLRLSIKSGLLSPAGRLCLSYLGGAALLGWGVSKKMRGRYWVLGQTLIGIGLGLFYFSSYAMTAMYHFVEPVTAGVIMFMVTLTAGVLSDRLNSIAVAMVAMVGGYATPLMLSTDSKSLVGLCLYLLLLVCGVLWLSYRKKWEQLVWLGILFTYFLFHLGIAYKFHVDEFGICMISLVLYFSLFSTSVFLYNVRYGQEVTALEIIGFVANSALFLLHGMLLISRINNGDRLYFAPLTLGLAFFYLAHAVFFVRRKRESERKLLLAFCALCGVYLAMTAPIVLSGHWLGAAWALQGLLMLWLGVRMESRFLRCCGWILYTMTLASLCLDFTNYGYLYRNGGQGASFWADVFARICQYGIPVACFAFGGKLTRELPQTVLGQDENDTDSNATEAPLSAVSVSGIMLNVAFALLMVFLLCECYVDFRFLNGAYRPFALTIVLSAGTLAAFIAWHRRMPGFWYGTFLVVLLGLVCKCVLADYISYGVVQRMNYRYIFSWNDSVGNILNFATMLTAGHFLRRMLSDNEREKKLGMCCSCLWPILLFLFSTTELRVILHHNLPELEVGGISVLWAAFAFAAIYYGVSHGIRLVRYVGLGLFLVVVLKVFFCDMARLEAVWRVGAFLAFGILLIGAAFVYLKYWRSASENTSKEEE